MIQPMEGAARDGAVESRVSWAETALLLAAASALLLPPVAEVAALAVAAALWWRLRPRRELWLVGIGLATATAVLAVNLAVDRSSTSSTGSSAGSSWRAEIPAVSEEYRSSWQRLEALASGAAAGIPAAPGDRGAVLDAFDFLQEQLEGASVPGATLLLFDPNGEAVAWAGEGLLHELDPFSLPRSGRAFRRGYHVVTLLAVEPLSDRRRPWRVVAGGSSITDELPWGEVAPGVRWSVAPAGSEVPPGGVAIPADGGPSLVLQGAEGAAGPVAEGAGWPRRLGLLILGFTLFGPVLRIADRRRATASASAPPGDPAFPLLTLAGVAIWGAAIGLSPTVETVLVVSTGIAAWGLGRPRRAAPPSPALRWAWLGPGLLGVAVAAVLAAGAWLLQHRFPLPDLAGGFFGGRDAVALRLAGCLAVLGLLKLAAYRLAPGGGDRAAWLATLLIAGAAAFHDRPAVGVPLLLVGTAAAVPWLAGVDLGRRPTAVGGLLVLAAVIAGTGWELAHRDRLRSRLENHYLPRLAPPSSEDQRRLEGELSAFFDRLDVGEFEPPGGGVTDLQDLAFVLWRESPLAQRDALSALVVEAPGGGRSTFSFGLFLDEGGRPAAEPIRWQIPDVEAWRGRMIAVEELPVAGEGGERGWRVSYWFIPRPGFRLEASEVHELERALVRGEADRRAVDGLPPGVHYALYHPGGEAIISPWQEAPPLREEPPSAGELWSGRAATPAGSAWYWLRRDADGVEALYLPYLTPLAGLERVGTHALGALVLIALATAVALLLALPRAAFRELLLRTVRSYSKRLILVYVVLLLAPLIALNLFLLRGFQERMQREQLAQAQGAIASARLFLIDYLSDLSRGFGIETRLDRELLEWVSRVAQHQVNLYWGSQLYTSSQHELFTAGLLPPRIPGEIYSRLALLGYEADYRIRRGEDVDYLEVYAPLQLPELAPSQQGLFLSVPLLEQEAEAGRELAALRRRAALVTTALVLLLMAVGSRLARSFTEPIMELIEGTRRIAGGARALGVTPREHELLALAGAIDVMAGRIAEGRRKLLREKELVERIVDNITSGVVSLDRRRRVLLQNRVAAELLGTGIGDEVAATGELEGRLERVARFVRDGGEEPRRENLRWHDEQGESREWTLTWVPLPGTEDPAALLVVDDVTEVVRGQRLEAWAEMARIIAHEIKNPLTPIQLSAEHMRQVYGHDRDRFDLVLERCTDNILRQVEELRDIASEFSIYSRIPKAELAPADLVAAMEELADAYRHAGEARIDLVADPGELRARFDKKLLGRAVRNLLENALRATDGRGRVELRVAREGGRAVIRVADSGPGVEPSTLRRIFEPYFSTYESGTGLGLAITRRIVEEHGGEIEARNREGGGLEVVATLPLTGDGGAEAE